MVHNVSGETEMSEFEGSDSLDTIDVTRDSNSEESDVTTTPNTEEQLDPGK